ncbi:hypothetical protein F965_00050 [Acinetobacter schindleri NIPH 900]|uniref:Uncharacterized protein n=2 Tax=Acinetobacter schindleri TaxID=108981 RepID=N8Y055_9GAMM|nr:hypothetical protein F965_00050 [Acinetobacter schindleri NIPH 900]
MPNLEILAMPESIQGPKRWEWFDTVNKQIADAVANGQGVTMGPDAAKHYHQMQTLLETKHVQQIAMHHNAVVVMACSMIEKDPVLKQEWIEEHLAQANENTYIMHKSAQAFYDQRALPFPETKEEHRANLAKAKQAEKQDQQRFPSWKQALEENSDAF